MRDIKIHLVILEGPDGVGKTTLREQFKKRCKEIFGLDMSFSTPYLVIDYAAGKTNHSNNIWALQPDWWGEDHGAKYRFHGSQMEVDLHRFRYSLQMNQITGELLDFLETYPHITNIILIQDRSWVSSIIYNNSNNFPHALHHHRAVVSELLRGIQDYGEQIIYTPIYIFITAENSDTIKQHKKQRSSDDYYEQKFNIEYLFDAYNSKYRELKDFFPDDEVMLLVNDYRPETIAEFTDAFIEDRLK
jgi:thymidylate kinase